MNLQLLPSGSSFYDKLKVAADRDGRAHRRLTALHTTLAQYGMAGEADMAEALLRMDALYGSGGRGRKPQPGDAKAKKLFEMHDFFVRCCAT
jgi:hypothetical protein